MLTRRILSHRHFSNTSRKFNLAVIGTGRMGRIRIQHILENPRVNLSYIIAENPSLAYAAEMEYNTKGVDDLACVLSDKNVDGIWISTPTSSHLDVILQAAQAKKHVAVEKPVSGTLSELNAAYAATEKHGVHLLCSFQRRFDNSYMQVQQAVTRGDVGDVQSIMGIFRDSPMPPIEFLKEGGDIFHDLAVHDIDYICDLMGAYPETVMASGMSLSPELQALQIMDTASVWLKFKGGMIAYLDLSRGSSYGYDQRMEVFGTKGMMQVLNPPDTSCVSSTASGVLTSTYVPSFPQRFQDAYRNELEHFLDLLQDGLEKPNSSPALLVPRVSKVQAQMATVLAEAAKTSAENNVSVHVGALEDIDFDNVQFKHHKN